MHSKLCLILSPICIAALIVAGCQTGAIEDEPPAIVEEESPAEITAAETAGEESGGRDISLIDGAECYDLTDIITIQGGLTNALITEAGLLAACFSSTEDLQNQAILYDLPGRQLLALEEVNGYYFRRMDENADSVTFAFFQYEDENWPQKLDYGTLTIDGQGHSEWRHTEAFGLPLGDGEVIERENGIAYINGNSEKMTMLAVFEEDIEEFDPNYAKLELFSVPDENRFIYFSMYDMFSLHTYIFDTQNGQNTPVGEYCGYPLEIRNGYLLSAINGYGVEGMIVIDLAGLEVLCEISYNNAGPSRASLSGDGTLVLAVYDKYDIHDNDGSVTNTNGFYLFDARSGQLLQEYALDIAEHSPSPYGFWGQRPYFFEESFKPGYEKRVLWVLPEAVFEEASLIGMRAADRIAADLQAHPELIPFEGVLGGIPYFYDITLLGNWENNGSGFVHALAEDGHWCGEMIYSFLFNEDGSITWKLLASRLMGELEYY